MKNPFEFTGNRTNAITLAALGIAVFAATPGSSHADAQSDCVDKVAASINEAASTGRLAKGAPQDSDAVGANLCSKKITSRAGDISVPQSPAFAVLGVSPENVSSPGSPDQFAIDILNATDPNGNFQSGVAMDFVPYLMFAGDDSTIAHYQTDARVKFLSRTQLSIATTKGQENSDEATRLAVGLNITPWIEHDPKLDKAFIECMANIADAAVAKAKQAVRDGKGDFETLVEAEYDTNAESCRKPFSKKAENGGAWRIGVAPKWISKDGDLDDLDFNGMTYWSSLAFDLNAAKVPGLDGVPGLGSLGRGIFQVRYQVDEDVVDPLNSNAFITEDNLSFTGKLEFEGPSDREGDILQDMRFAASATYIHADRENRDNDTYYQYNAELKMRVPNIGENLWLIATLGQTSDRDGGDETFVGTSLKWAFNDPGK